MKKFHVYTKTALTCAYHMEEAESLDTLVERLNGNMIRWQIAKVFGHTRVTLDKMPHKTAILIAGNSRNFIAVEDAEKADNAPAYSDGEAYWNLH